MDNAVRQSRLSPSGSTASAITALIVDEWSSDLPGVSMPRAEVHLVVRFGPSARGGLDVHALGGKPRAHRKLIRTGQRAVTARLRLGAHEAVLGVPASVLFERIVALEDLWGGRAARRLTEQLASARDGVAAAAILEQAIAGRIALADAPHAHARLALDAAERLGTASISAIADELDVSERTLRRVFRDAIGMSPKAFAKLARFHRALGAARVHLDAGWASIAAEAGYYDQAHLIAEFRDITGVTPRALLRELQGSAANPTREPRMEHAEARLCGLGLAPHPTPLTPTE